jgi:peptide/nickel transport system ATP-binding protein
VLAVSDLHVEFATRQGAARAVGGLDLTVDRGEVVGLVGESGSGKTVTALSILRLVRAPGRMTRGTIELDGVALPELSERDLRAVRGARLAYVPQNPRGSLNPLLRVGKQLENILSAHATGPSGRTARRERCLETIEAVGLPDPVRVFRSYPHELSGGMAQRVLIAAALLLSPDLVIADEPTTGLDVTVQAQILDLFENRVRTEGAGALLVTHDLGIVANYCDRVVVMYAGRVVEAGTTKDIFEQPSHPYTQGLLRSSPVLGEPLYSMPGSAPDLRSLPAGCPFAARCSEAHEACLTEPPWRDAGNGHGFRCHLPEGGPRVQAR